MSNAAESDDLATARASLAKAESMLATADGLHRLQQGLALLERVVESEADADSQAVARNLGRAYTERIYGQIGQLIEGTRAPSEPELEHLFAVIRAFDDACFELPAASVKLKVEIVTRLVGFYSEGYTPAQRQELLEQLAEVSKSGDDGSC